MFRSEHEGGGIDIELANMGLSTLAQAALSDPEQHQPEVGHAHSGLEDRISVN